MTGLDDRIPLLDEILGEWTEALGNDYAGYRNHVYRMVNFCFALFEANEEERHKFVIAGCFHDLGIWSEQTFDYLPPSIALASDYLRRKGLDEWIPEIELVIGQHHKLRPFRNTRCPLVEPFRRADLADFSLGLLRRGIPKTFYREVTSAFPNAGFHKRLVQLELGWVVRHPLRPLPVVKW